MSRPPPPPAARAARWLLAIQSLAEHGLRVQLALGEIESGDPRELAEGLDEMCLRAERGERAAREVLLAFVAVLVDPAVVTRVRAIRAAAEAHALGAVARLLSGSSPDGHRGAVESRGEREAQAAAAQAALRHADGRPLTLGERRALARAPSRAVLHRLARDVHPMVLRLLLANPRLTEPDVVDMAARRPAAAATLAEIARAWTRYPRVRRAVVLNPGCPAAVSTPLLALLSRPELHQVADATDLPGPLRVTARELAERRPPRESFEPDDLELPG
jgi:hypothetical protein